MNGYRLIEYLNEGLVRLDSPRWGPQLWSSVRLRKPARCAECHLDKVAGVQAFRPITNGGNRYHRLCLGCLTRLPIATRCLPRT